MLNSEGLYMNIYGNRNTKLFSIELQLGNFLDLSTIRCLFSNILIILETPAVTPQE